MIIFTYSLSGDRMTTTVPTEKYGDLVDRPRVARMGPNDWHQDYPGGAQSLPRKRCPVGPGVEPLFPSQKFKGIDVLKMPIVPTYSETPAPGGWKYVDDQVGVSAEAVTPVKYGESISLHLDCYEGEPRVQLGYSGNHVKLPDPKRSMVYAYMRSIFVDEPVLSFVSGGKVLGRVAWSPYDGGTGKLGRAQMSALYAADKIMLSGGKAKFEFSVLNLKAVVDAIRPRCKL